MSHFTSRMRMELRSGEQIIVGNNTTITFDRKNGTRVRVTIEAPRPVRIERGAAPKSPYELPQDGGEQEDLAISQLAGIVPPGK